MKSVKKYQAGGIQYFRPLAKEEMTGIREGLQEWMQKRRKKKAGEVAREEAIYDEELQPNLQEIEDTFAEDVEDDASPLELKMGAEELKRKMQAKRGTARHQLMLDELRKRLGFGDATKVNLTRGTGPRV